MSDDGIDPRKFKAVLLEAPEQHLDPALKEFIQDWDENPTPIQVLQVLDFCVHGSMASDFATNLVRMIYDNALTLYHVSHEDTLMRRYLARMM